MKVIAIGATALVILAASTTGTFFAGQSTRASADAVNTRLDTEVAAQQARDTTHETRTVKAAVKTQRTHDMRVLKRTARRLRASYKRKMDEAYTNGRSAGYSSGEANGQASGRVQGYSNGHTDGLVQGSDSLTCSDDFDVTWLPFCSY